MFFKMYAKNGQKMQFMLIFMSNNLSNLAVLNIDGLRGKAYLVGINIQL